MLAILLETIPFFALLGLGWAAGRTPLFPPEATEWLTRFVFFFPLSAMLFGFAANLPLAQIFDPAFVLAYLSGSFVVWGLAMAVARFRRRPLAEAAMESYAVVVGNTGFLGLPLLAVLLGPRAAGPILMVLTLDLVVFSVLAALLITGARYGRVALGALGPLARGLAKNPMILSIAAGLAWSLLGVPLPDPIADAVSLLAAAATPGALFAIGASLASHGRPADGVAAWISLCKLVLHPAAVAVAALLVFPVEPQAAGVMIAAAALPVAGNVYMMASHYGVAQQRISAAVLISTLCSIATLPLVIAWVGGGAE